MKAKGASAMEVSGSSGGVCPKGGSQGAFMVYMIDQIIDALDKLIKDPTVPPAKKDAILESFSPGLEEFNAVLQAAIDRREQLGNLRQGMAVSAEQAAATTADAELAMRLRQNILVPRASLLAAARRHMDAKPAPQQILADQPELTVPAPVKNKPRII